MSTADMRTLSELSAVADRFAAAHPAIVSVLDDILEEGHTPAEACLIIRGQHTSPSTALLADLAEIYLTARSTPAPPSD